MYCSKSIFPKKVYLQYVIWQLGKFSVSNFFLTFTYITTYDNMADSRRIALSKTFSLVHGLFKKRIGAHENKQEPTKVVYLIVAEKN